MRRAIVGLMAQAALAWAFAQTAPAAKPTQPELVGTVPYATSARPVQYLMIQVGDGDRGPTKRCWWGTRT
jgi:hypothetical protein